MEARAVTTRKQISKHEIQKKTSSTGLRLVAADDNDRTATSAELYDVAVIGLGYVGLPLCLAFAKSGANVLGVDVDASKAKKNRCR